MLTVQGFEETELFNFSGAGLLVLRQLFEGLLVLACGHLAFEVEPFKFRARDEQRGGGGGADDLVGIRLLRGERAAEEFHVVAVWGVGGSSLGLRGKRNGTQDKRDGKERCGGGSHVHAAGLIEMPGGGKLGEAANQAAARSHPPLRRTVMRL